MLERIIVVVQFGVRVRLVGELKRLGNVIIADDAQPLRLAQGAVFVQSLVDHVPDLDAALIAADDSVNVIPHPFQQRVARERFAAGVAENPPGRLAVPDQRVADDRHVVGFAERNIPIAGVEIKRVRARVDDFPLEHVFRRNGIELRLNDGIAALISVGKLAGIDGHAHEEIVFEGFLERDRPVRAGLRCRATGEDANGGEGGPASDLFLAVNFHVNDFSSVAQRISGAVRPVRQPFEWFFVFGDRITQQQDRANGEEQADDCAAAHAKTLDALRKIRLVSIVVAKHQSCSRETCRIAQGQAGFRPKPIVAKTVPVKATANRPFRKITRHPRRWPTPGEWWVRKPPPRRSSRQPCR